MRRVAIIGPAGAGKTTLALELGQILGVDVVQLNKLLWQPGWIKYPRRGVRSDPTRGARGDAWITDSIAPRALRKRLEAADTLCFLFLPLRLCAFRALRRRSRTRGGGGVEGSNPRSGLLRGSRDRAARRYLRYARTYRTETRPHILRELDRLRPGRRVIVLRSPRDVRQFVDALRYSAARTDGHTRSELPGATVVRLGESVRGTSPRSGRRECRPAPRGKSREMPAYFVGVLLLARTLGPAGRGEIAFLLVLTLVSSSRSDPRRRRGGEHGLRRPAAGEAHARVAQMTRSPLSRSRGAARGRSSGPGASCSCSTLAARRRSARRLLTSSSWPRRSRLPSAMQVSVTCFARPIREQALITAATP